MELTLNFLPASADISNKGGALCANPQKPEAGHGTFSMDMSRLRGRTKTCPPFC